MTGYVIYPPFYLGQLTCGFVCFVILALCDEWRQECIKDKSEKKLSHYLDEEDESQEGEEEEDYERGGD